MFTIAQRHRCKVEDMNKPIVCVAALTYKRPQGIKELLAGLNALACPKGWSVRYLIVDNDPNGSAESAVRAAQGSFDGRLDYVIEDKVGIPAARNRALREGIAAGATLFCFIDDDETPAVDWLTELVLHRERTGAMLIGGPLRRTLSGRPRSFAHRIFARSLVARRRLAESWAALRASRGRSVPVYTSNWMCDLTVAREHGIFFDEAMRFSGGSDAAFDRAVIDQGLPTSWCPTAIVSEPIAQERLSIRYQFRRSRDQGIVRASLTDASLPQILLREIPRFGAGAILLVVPVLGMASFSAGLHLIASSLGHLQYRRGAQSNLYARQSVAS